jgi:hypothetical protein
VWPTGAYAAASRDEKAFRAKRKSRLLFKLTTCDEVAQVSKRRGERGALQLAFDQNFF